MWKKAVEQFKIYRQDLIYKPWTNHNDFCIDSRAICEIAASYLPYF